MQRKSVSLEELFNILHMDFQGARSALCRSCVTPLPVRRAPADDVSANWFVVEPQDCGRGCRVILAEIVTRLMSEYELERSVYGAQRRSLKSMT